jgi:hypothetical protein
MVTGFYNTISVANAFQSPPSGSYRFSNTLLMDHIPVNILCRCTANTTIVRSKQAWYLSLLVPWQNQALILPWRRLCVAARELKLKLQSREGGAWSQFPQAAPPPPAQIGSVWIDFSVRLRLKPCLPWLRCSGHQHCLPLDLLHHIPGGQTVRLLWICLRY